jgi:hypothetical protein
MARPKKTPVAKVAPENDSMSQDNQKALMQEQWKAQLKMMLKSAKAAGIDLNDVFEQPPAETAVTMNSADLASVISTAVKEAVTATKDVLGGRAAGIPLDAYGQPVNNPGGRMKPGQIIPGTQNFVPWSMNDLDPENVVTFSPLPIPSLIWPLIDVHGRQKIKLDKNGLVQWLTVGETCTINQYFYDQYEDAYKQWMEVEKFKRTGPVGPNVPWGLKDDGTPAWSFTPFAASYGMTEEGRSLRVGPPTALDFISGEVPQTGSEGQ